MPESLRVRIKKLHYKGEFNDSQTERLLKLLDMEKQNAPDKNVGWIPIKYRPMTDEEKKDYSERTGYAIEDLDFMFDCFLPEDGEVVLVTDRLGNVEVDTFINDCDGCYFECNCDMDDVTAWMSIPEPYKKVSQAIVNDSQGLVKEVEE